MTDKLKLTFATSDYDHFRDIPLGRVPVEGIDLNVLDLEIEEIFYRFTLHREWDVSEMSLAKFVAQVGGDRPDIIGLPVFPSRVFRLSNIYINTDSGIEKPEDLRGKRIGTPEWAQTASVYTRGWLTDHVGIPLQDVDWHQAGVNQPGRVEKVTLNLPEGVKLTPQPERSIGDMLATGDLDAAFSAHAPDTFVAGHPKIKRLFPDYQAAEQAYYEQTKVFPIMHIIAIQQHVLDDNPWVAGNLYTAFLKARERAIERLHEITASRITIPWITDVAEKSEKLLGEDFFPYGIEPNRRTLEAFLKWHFEQGITKRLLKIEELFPESLQGQFKI
jgi:4,5-dihydroxyphthalate decarboxylase